MKPIYLPAAIIVVVLGLSSPHAWARKFSLFSRSWGNVVVATDTTEEGKEITPPTAENPVYYRGLSLGARLGTTPGDRLPDVPEMSQFVADVLARQGYLVAVPGVHEPTLLLVLQWGYLSPGSGELLWFLGYDPSNDIGAEMSGAGLGAGALRRNFRSGEITTILDNANDPIYGIIVTAFKFQPPNTPDPVIYWQTRIGLPANGKSMKDALPTMVIAAGPAIGRESDTPVLLSTKNLLKGRVEYGELKVIGFEDETAPAEEGSESQK